MKKRVEWVFQANADGTIRWYDYALFDKRVKLLRFFETRGFGRMVERTITERVIKRKGKK